LSAWDKPLSDLAEWEKTFHHVISPQEELFPGMSHAPFVNLPDMSEGLGMECLVGIYCDVLECHAVYWDVVECAGSVGRLP